jgi:hypothetical protein
VRGFLAALAVSVGLLAMPVPAEAQRAPETFYVGDSIGAIMADYGLLNFDHIDSVPGRPMQEGPEVIRGFNLQAGDTLVVELGTNNLTEGGYLGKIESILTAVPDDVCLTWVTPMNFWHPEAGAAFFGELAAGLALSGQCITDLVRWDLLGEAWMTYDTVHPTYAGAWYLAALIQPITEPLG